MATYYASRLTPAELTEIVTYNDSDLGRRSRDQPQTLTPEDRQQRALYFADHPALIKLTQVAIGYSKLEMADRAAQAADFKAKFERYFCEDLAKAHVSSSICLIGRH